jgi:hypothetical protein
MVDVKSTIALPRLGGGDVLELRGMGKAARINNQ